MPILKRKPVQPLPVPDTLLTAKAKGEDPNVFYLSATGELFADYV